MSAFQTVCELLAIFAGSCFALLVVLFMSINCPPPGGICLALLALGGVFFTGYQTGLVLLTVLLFAAVAIIIGIGALVHTSGQAEDLVASVRIRIFGYHQVGPRPSWRCRYFGWHVFALNRGTGWMRCKRCGLNR